MTMTTTTTAAVLREPDGSFQIEEVTLADLGPTEVLVRIAGAGFCHTDVLPRGMAAQALPAILGHEGSGVVVEVGAEVTEVAPGDVVVLSFASCGRCGRCVTGHPAYCVDFLALNLTGRDLAGNASAVDAAGAPVANRWFGQSSFAGHAVVDQRGAVRVDPDLPIELLGPLGCGIQTGAGTVLNVMRPVAGQSIVVFGAGAVGLAAVMAAKLAGASDIVAVDLHQSRLDLAVELGATRALLASDSDLVGKLVGDSSGLDFAFDTTGLESVMDLALDALGHGGLLVLVGASMDNLVVHPTRLTGKRVTYVLEGDADPQVFIPTLIEHWRSGRFPFDRLVTTFPLTGIDEAEAATRTGAAIKPVLLPARA
jgi:aryl-alcohol dehydrogenase